MAQYQYKGRGFLQGTGRSNMAINNPITINGSTFSNVGSSSNTISLSGTHGIQGFTAQQIQSLEPMVFRFEETNIKKYEIIESTQDILALSSAWKRLREDPVSQKKHIGVNVSSMLDGDLFSIVNQDDIDYANKIRDYYQKKFTVLALKSIELSPFRKELKEIINTDGKKFKESIIPIAYRMPEFYEYDLEFESLLFENNRELKNFDSMVTSKKLHLTLEKTFQVNGKKSKRREYWFSDSDKNLVTYFVENSNPLKGLFEHYVTQGNITLSAICKKRERDGYEYIKIHNVDFG